MHPALPRGLAAEQMRENLGFVHDTLEQVVSALESMRDDLESLPALPRVGRGEAKRFLTQLFGPNLNVIDLTSLAETCSFYFNFYLDRGTKRRKAVLWK
jgi:hypothetical protein